MPAKQLSTNREQTVLERCQAVIGYQFQKPDLLRAALTHTSGANTRLGSNERMEFLGDSVLGLVTCEQLYSRFPEYQEGELTKVKSVVVSRKTCARFSQELGLGKFLILGKGMGMNGELSSNVLADVYEALVGAVFLDGGWDAAKAFVLPHIVPEVERIAEEAIGSNAKSLLQQVCQREFGETPRYVVLDEQGPDHNRCYKMAAAISDHVWTGAWGKNKKEAELEAALKALAEITGESSPFPPR